jgi:nitrogen regulatory protein PII
LSKIENNILILGPPASGKKTVVLNIKDKNAKIKTASYRSAIINNEKIHLFSSKEEEKLESFERIISSFENGEITQGIIILIDNSKGITKTDNDIVNMVVSKKIPHVIFSNKNDLSNKAINTNFEDSLIIPTIATEGIGINDGFRLLLKLIIKKEENKKTVKKSEYIDNVSNIEKIENKFYHEETPELKELIEKSDNQDICQMKITLHPIELENMVQIFENCGFSNMTVVEIKYMDEQKLSRETYRGSQYNIRMKMKVEMIMIVKKDDVKYVLKAIESIKSNDIDDKIFITPIERVLRVRTLEEGLEAID